MPGNSGANRQDNRQRGNAAQLLEKYKSLARDSQLAGDRVQTEYYLQYADHYFRILEESRSRYEDQQGQGQGQRRRRDEDDDEMDGDEEMSGEDNSQDEDDAEPVRQQQQQRPRRERFERSERTERPERAEPRRANGARRDEEPEGEERIALGVLPPAIGAPDEAQEEEAPKPRRRARKPRAESNDDEIAPAA
jgi:hypothetical protein